MIWQEKIDAALDARRVADALRRRYPVAQGAGRWLVADDCQYLNFSSNDYLGLSHHPQIIRAGSRARINLVSVAAVPVTSAVIAWRTGAGRRTGRMAGLFAGAAVYFWFCR